MARFFSLLFINLLSFCYNCNNFIMFRYVLDIT